MDILVEHYSDSCDCETCGPSFAEGYRLTFGDGTVIEKLPVARCYGEQSYSDDDLYNDIFQHLGVKVTHEFVTDGEEG